MRHRLGVAVLLSISCSSAFAVMISRFVDAARFVERAHDIVIAEYAASPESSDGEELKIVEVNVLKTIKGTRRVGPFKIAAVDISHPMFGMHPMTPGTTYMLANSGGKVSDTDFLATGELSVVPLPADFHLEELEGMTPLEQVQCIFSRRLFELERELAPLLEEQALLEKGLRDRRYEWWESEKPIQIGQVFEATTEGMGNAYLDLRGVKMSWSQCTGGKDGHFYFSKMGEHTPFWEFAPCDAATVEDFAKGPLKVKFYGRYTPGRAETAFGWRGPDAVIVAVGQVILARTVDAPNRIFIIQVKAQEPAQDKTGERMTARYAVIGE